MMVDLFKEANPLYYVYVTGRRGSASYAGNYGDSGSANRGMKDINGKHVDNIPW